jgi:hypothetical protein
MIRKTAKGKYGINYDEEIAVYALLKRGTKSFAVCAGVSDPFEEPEISSAMANTGFTKAPAQGMSIDEYRY